MTRPPGDLDLVQLLHNDCKNLIIKKLFNVSLSKKTQPAVLDAIDTISSIHMTSQQVVHWTPIIAPSLNW